MHRATFVRMLARTLVLALAVATIVVPAGTARADEPPRHIRVATAGTEPFVVGTARQPQGIAVDIFREVARGSGLEIEFVPMDSVAAALDAVARREVDVAVGPISITAERSERVSFTQPYFQSSLGILAPQSRSWLARLSGVLSRAFVVGIAILLLVLLVVGTFIWLAERKANPTHFPPRPARGIANGVWFALVTMTTVGYGDRVPTTTAGRVVAGVWMVMALLFASSLTAAIATAVTVAVLAPGQISSVEQLANQRAAVVRRTPAVAFARRAGARLVLVGSFEEGVARVSRGEADALVFDRPMMRYYLQQNPEADLVVSEASYAPQGYGFAASDTALQHRLDVALLRAAENGVVKRITSDWLGATVDDEH